MEVSLASFSSEYAGISYVFCSAQCKERFLANPHLYIGTPGHKAPAQCGARVIKKRSMVLSAPLDDVQIERVKNALLTMMGVEAVYIAADKMTIQYDLMQVTAEQIADKLALIGAELGGGWVERLKRGFINYQEECEIGNLEAPHDPSCH